MMKKILSKITLAALAVALLGSCSKINERLDNLEKRVDGIGSEEIASIGSQIAGIQSSISDLDRVRADIYELQTSGAVQGTGLAMLEASYESLGIRIDDLQDFVDATVPSYATKEWVEATFSTLEQYEATCDTIAKVDARIGALDAKLSKDIRTCADSLKRWVNEQFDAYYTAAEADAKLGEMQADLDLAGEITDETAAEADSLAAEFAKVKTLIDAAKAELKAEYKTAVEKAITESEGKITFRIAEAVGKAGEDVLAIAEKVDDFKSQVDDLKKIVGALKGRIQSVTIVPAYGDGSVKVENDSLYLTCIIKPASAVKGLTKDNFSLIKQEVKTKKAFADNSVDTCIIIDKTKGVVELRKNIADYLYGTESLAVALSVKTDFTTYTTEYVKVTTLLIYNISGPTSRVWVWNTDGNGCWGHAGNSGNVDDFADVIPIPTKWWGAESPEKLLDQLQDVGNEATGAESSDAYMTFTAKGNLTSFDKDENVIAETKWEIENFDESRPSGWELGKLKVDNSRGILFPFIKSGGGKEVTEFDIMYLNENYMTLVYTNGNGAGGWGEITFWRFKSKVAAED